MKRAALAAVPLVLSILLGSCLSTVSSLLGQYSGGGSGPAARPAITNAEAVKALKDALTEGIKSASGKLSLQDAYFKDALLKILLPPEAKPILDSVGKIPGGQKLIDDVVLRLNRSAEESAKEVMPIFVDAITAITIADGIAIVKGGDEAATRYLKDKTRARLVELYRPKVQAAMDQPLVLGVSAQKSWDTLLSAYNAAAKVPNSAAALLGQSPPMPPIKADIAGHATERALDGLFLKVAEEEKKIRAHPAEYASAMIKKVFGALLEGWL